LVYGGTSLQPLHKLFGGLDGVPIVPGKFMPMRTAISVSPRAIDVSTVADRDERSVVGADRLANGNHLMREFHADLNLPKLR
jgi:hypothetical protein